MNDGIKKYDEIVVDDVRCRIIGVYTAEDIGDDARGRVPAVVVSLRDGREPSRPLAALMIDGSWTFATRPCREWQTPDGNLVEGDEAEAIDAALRNT